MNIIQSIFKKKQINNNHNNDNQFIKLPFVIKSKIFKLLDHYYSFQLYKTCKDLHQLKYIIVDRIELKDDSFDSNGCLVSDYDYNKLIESRLIERTKKIVSTFHTFKVIIKELEKTKNNILLESFLLYDYIGQPIIDLYPKYLTKLVLEFPRGSTVLVALPDTIEDLELYYLEIIHYNEIILNHKLLPKYLKRLYAPHCRVDQFIWDSTMTDLYLKEIDWSLPFPSTIDTVGINKLTIDQKGFKFPSTITSLSLKLPHSIASTLDLDTNCLPNNLKYLYLGNVVLNESTIHQLPSTLTHLFNYNSLPNRLNINQLINLVVVVFPGSFNFVIPANSLPPSIKELTFGYGFKQLLTNDIIPPRLEILTIKSNIMLPRMTTSLKELHFHQFSYFNQPIDQMELESTQLTTINFGDQFNQPLCDPLGRSYLPPTLCHLTIGPYFKQSLESVPPSVYHISLISKDISLESKYLKVFNIPSTVTRINKI